MRKKIALLGLLCVLTVAAMAQGALPPTGVFAEQFNNWSLASQSANTYTFTGTNCFNYPLVNGSLQPYFVFGPTAAAYPIYIQDANPSNSEIVTPSSTSTTTPCGFSASTTYTHTSFTVLSGTAGLQDAVGTLASSATPVRPSVVYIDAYYYQLVSGLPGSQSVPAIIRALKGTTGVNLVDITTAPFTWYTWNGTQYVVSGQSMLAPTLAVTGAGAGTGPASTSIAGNNSSGIVGFTTGTTPTASAAVFTLTWPSLANGGFSYAPSCTFTSVGTNAYTSGVASSVAGPPAVATFTASATALTASTAYVFAYRCH